MNHDEARELLEAYVDETLDRQTRATVDDHLASCPECRAILDGVAAVPLGPGSTGGVDETSVRRSVRTATFRTIVDAALMLLGVWLALWLVAVLVVQPFVINRGGRAATMTEATLDLATMLNPGVWVEEFEIQSTALGRTATATVALPIGGGLQPLGEISSRVGPLGFGDADGGSFFPFVQNDSRSMTDARSILPNLGEGTVATVALWPAGAITIDQAQAIADSTEHDIAVVWAGFSVGEPSAGSPPGFERGGTLGYSTCLSADTVDDALFGATSASLGRGTGFAPASIADAYERVRSAVDNLTKRPEIAEGFSPGIDPDRVKAAATELADREPAVTALVVTGPTAEVLELVDAQPDAGVSLLGVDFYNWPVCGR